MKIASFAIALLTGIAATAAAAAPPAASLSYNKRLQQLDKPRQAAALRNAIVESGKRCGQIEPPLYRGPYKNLFLWVARCVGGDYALFVGPDGSVQVRDCDQTVQLKLPACGLPPAPPAKKTRPRRG
jgi:hypothetical protein